MALWLGPSIADADVVPPPPPSCPEGSEGAACHGGPFCSPKFCPDAGVCDGGDTCEQRQLCIGDFDCFMTTTPAVYSVCPCSEGTCQTVSVCVPPSGTGGAGGAAGSGGTGGTSGSGGSGATTPTGGTAGSGATATGGSGGAVGSGGQEPVKEDSGCGCRLGSRGAHPHAWLGLLLGGGVLCMRRRRSSTRTRY